jgi:hypothetical protein
VSLLVGSITTYGSINDPTSFTDPSVWTIEGEWNTNDGDMAGIVSAMTTVRNNGFWWNPDGTRLHVCNTSDDGIRTFTCSTPFDPDTASNLTNKGETNPNHPKVNGAGSKVLWIRNVGDEISHWPANNYTISGGAGEDSDITKSDVGFTGNQDGTFTCDKDMTYLLWLGEVGTTSNIKYITVGAGTDLDNFTVQATQNIETPMPTVEKGLSMLSLDELSFYLCEGGAGVRLVTMDEPHDIATINFGTIEDLDTQFTSPISGWNILHIWIDPANTQYVWVGGDDSGMQLAKFNTGV